MAVKKTKIRNQSARFPILKYEFKDRTTLELTPSKPICTRCGEERANSDFYLSRSDLYKYYDSKFTVCKTCMNEIYETFTKRYDDETKALYHICMMFDIYFHKDMAMSCSMKENSFPDYMRQMNSLPNHKDKTSLNSNHIILDDNLLLSERKPKKSKAIKVTPELKNKWITGDYTDDELIMLEHFYNDYYNNIDHQNDYMKLKIIKEICGYELIISQARKSKDNKIIAEFSKIISQKMADAKLKPSQQKVVGEADDDIFGMKLYIYEKKKPVPKPLKEYLDVDKFWKYLLKHMIKPLSVAMGVAKGEYTLEGGDEDIEFDKAMSDALEESVKNGE